MYLGFLAASALAGPQLQLGGRAAAHLSSFQVTYQDPTQDLRYRMTYEDQFWALGLEAVYGPLWLFRVRLDLAEARLFWAGAGALSVLPTPGADVMLYAPMYGRFKPYVWAGGQVTKYIGNQDPDVIDARFATGTERHIRAGIGATHALTPAIDIFLEVELFEEDTYLDVDAYASMAGAWVTGGMGIHQVQLGARFTVTK